MHNIKLSDLADDALKRMTPLKYFIYITISLTIHNLKATCYTFSMNFIEFNYISITDTIVFVHWWAKIEEKIKY